MDFDIANLLDSDEAMEAGDSKFIASALGVLAARGAPDSRCRILRKNPYDAELVVAKDYVEIDVID
ncbi:MULTISPECIES: hypothetical protein [Rhizobium]|uniref:Uncharacterized protein n=1 Tax=Rhizobium esperanzae TaxID=1967781 RepID=A0A7W6UNU3_9HYPH|nr:MULTISPECIES: hypothetical protein [Rhizobium]ASS60189.1 hypothetical protein CHR56_37105 [Rhizobium leguminosarum bv. viciae]MBB4343235.1 hypothetical protein [Rhizobium leguminosarum]MBB4441525.1 hypothetical protein [Rhizobium esperanzae]MBB5261096.1 hypothetical protein [Rhizobium leguminosarum]MBB6296313.1 hypothetical protein [Rhizobium leguminosarum]